MPAATVCAARRVLLACVLMCLCLSCRRKEFDVEFEMDSGADGAYSCVYYASDAVKGRITEGVVELRQGRGSFHAVTVLPTLFTIMDRGGGTGLVAYAGRGDRLKVTGSSADPLQWKVTGNSISETLSNWRVSNAAVIRRAMSGAEAAVKALNDAVGAFVIANPAKPAAALILYLYYDRRSDYDGFRKLFGRLEGDAAAQKWRDLAGTPDLFEGAPEIAGIPSSLALKTFQTGCDTLAPGRVPILIYVSETSMESYGADMGLLRGLSREVPDSSRRVIVNFSTDPDSLARAHTWRRDSLTAAVQAWVPLGLTDPQLEALGVPRTPWVIVIDRSGKAVYRGPDMSRGIDLLKKALN